MTIRKVARAGHPVLRQRAQEVPVERIGSPEVQAFIDDLFETMEEYDGAGLAAPQVHESVRIVVLTVDDEKGPEVWVNPVLTPLTEDRIVSYEGCLSVPGLRGAVSRVSKLGVQAYDRDGNPFEIELEGFPAIVAQHECDHLDGVLYIDRADPRTITFLEEYRRFGAWPLEGLEEAGEE